MKIVLVNKNEYIDTLTKIYDWYGREKHPYALFKTDEVEYFVNIEKFAFFVEDFMDYLEEYNNKELEEALYNLLKIIQNIVKEDYSHIVFQKENK